MQRTFGLTLTYVSEDTSELCHYESKGTIQTINAMMVLELADDAEAVRVARDLAATLQRTVILKDQEGTVLATVSQTATVRARVEASIKNE